MCLSNPHLHSEMNIEMRKQGVVWTLISFIKILCTRQCDPYNQFSRYANPTIDFLAYAKI